jgi:hypothetical protein
MAREKSPAIESSAELEIVVLDRARADFGKLVKLPADEAEQLKKSGGAREPSALDRALQT